MERIIRNRVLAASNRATPAIDAKVENLILERLRFSFKCEQLLLYDIKDEGGWEECECATGPKAVRMSLTLSLLA